MRKQQQANFWASKAVEEQAKAKKSEPLKEESAVKMTALLSRNP